MFGSFLFLVPLVIVSIVCAVLGLLLVRRYVDHETLASHHDVAGYLISIVGTLYAVVVGFIVVGSLNTFENARLTVTHEANALHNIFHLAKGLGQPARFNLRNACIAYAKAMIEDEWPVMELGESSPQAHQLVVDLWDTVVDIHPTTQAEADLHNSVLAEMNALADSRHIRLIGAEPHYAWITWTVLIFGGFVLVVFTYFFGVENLAVQILTTVLVTIALSLNLCMVALFGYPYSGDVKVEPTAFVRDLTLFSQELNESSSFKKTP